MPLLVAAGRSVYRRDGRKSFSWRDYRDLLIAAHQQLGGPIALIWDNLNVHKAAGLRQFAASRDWLTIHYLPPYAPDLNPVEGIWSPLRRGWLSNVAFSTPEHLVQRIRRGLRHIQYRSDLVDGCLAETCPEHTGEVRRGDVRGPGQSWDVSRRA
ncbi:transposase [Streptomyces sp. NPDC001599]|uniref:transposase n=1 Tax=Streptomyces sp. NPDC001599 TaxID=3364591 RepID=UPI0036CF1096